MTNSRTLFILLVTLICAAVLPERSVGYSIFLDNANNGHASGMVAWLQSWGNSVTAVSDYKGENLSGYDIVMDFDNDSWRPLTLQERSAYTSFLRQGGGLYLQGERPTNDYILRDQSVLAYLDTLGAGIINVDWRDIFINIQDPYVHATLSPVTHNRSLKFRYDTSLIITNPGNGFFVATTNAINYPVPPYTGEVVHIEGVFSNVIGFEQGQLLNAPNGRVIGFFDTTYLDTGRFDENQPFFQQVVSFLGNSEPLAPVPEPSSFMLVIGGGALLFAIVPRMKRRSLSRNRGA